MPKIPVADEDDSLIMSIKLRSGRFESSIEVPLFATDDERASFIDSWLKLMEQGLKVGHTHRSRKPPPPPPEQPPFKKP